MQQITWAAGTVVDEGAGAYHMQHQQQPNHSAAMDCEPTLQIGYARPPYIQLFMHALHWACELNIHLDAEMQDKHKN
jgi:hypothetical protein